MIGTDELQLIRDYASIFATSKDRCFYRIIAKSGFTNEIKSKKDEVRFSLHWRIYIPKHYSAIVDKLHINKPLITTVISSVTGWRISLVYTISAEDQLIY